MSASITLNIEEKLKEQLDAIAETTQRPSSDLAEEALRNYVDINAHHVAIIERAIRETGEVGTVPDEEVEAWVLSWGTEEELPIPRVRRKEGD